MYNKMNSLQSCKNEEKLLERLHKAILNVTANLEMSRQTNAIRTLFWQTLSPVGECGH